MEQPPKSSPPAPSWSSVLRAKWPAASAGGHQSLEGGAQSHCCHLVTKIINKSLVLYMYMCASFVLYRANLKFPAQFLDGKVNNRAALERGSLLGRQVYHLPSCASWYGGQQWQSDITATLGTNSRTLYTHALATLTTHWPGNKRDTGLNCQTYFWA